MERVFTENRTPKPPTALDRVPRAEPTTNRSAKTAAVYERHVEAIGCTDVAGAAAAPVLASAPVYNDWDEA